MENVLARFRLNEPRKSAATKFPQSGQPQSTKSIDNILTELSDKTKALKKQQMNIREGSDSDSTKEDDPSSGSDLLTPATDSFEYVSQQGSKESGNTRMEAAEILKVREELALAQAKIALQDQELAESRIFKHTMDQAIGSGSEADLAPTAMPVMAMEDMPTPFNASARPFTLRSDSWSQSGGSRPSTSGVSAGHRGGRGAWPSQHELGYPDNLSIGPGPLTLYDSSLNDAMTGRAYGHPCLDQMSPLETNFNAGSHAFSMSSTNASGFATRGSFDSYTSGIPKHNRHGQDFARNGPMYNERGLTYSATGRPIGATIPTDINPVGMPPAYGYGSRPLASPISPVGSDYSAGALQGLPTWSNVSLAASRDRSPI